MKKYLIFALILCAIPAVAFGQKVGCDACTHVASVYMGEGGFIAMAGEDAKMVTWVATCGGVTRSGELPPNDDGVVAALWAGDTACMDEKGGEFQVGPVMDGGWFWITDDMNSAVGGLVSNDVLENDTVDITSAGDGVEMTTGKGAVYLKETATGRVGILPNILPEMPATPLKKCGFSGAATGASPAKPVNTECALGDGKTTLLMTSTNAITGATVRIMDKGSVTRPAGSGTLTILADLWGNGTGHYVTSHDAAVGNGVSAMRGQTAVAMNATARPLTRYTGVGYTVSVSSGGPGTGTAITSGTRVGGVDYSDSENLATITVADDDSYCSKTANHTATVMVVANMATETDANQVIPAIVRSATSTPVGRVGSASFKVTCPAASANMGQELVPDNPFPTDR